MKTAVSIRLYLRQTLQNIDSSADQHIIFINKVDEQDQDAHIDISVSEGQAKPLFSGNSIYPVGSSKEKRHKGAVRNKRMVLNAQKKMAFKESLQSPAALLTEPAVELVGAFW